VSDVAAALRTYLPRSAGEEHDVARVRALVDRADPWSRVSPLHVTGSALVVHPPTRRVLLRWHARMQAWLQVGGHGDPGESSPFLVASREAAEETGLHDLAAWPEPAVPWLVHVVIVPVPAARGEDAHEHADFRYVLATESPDAIVAEEASARPRWCTLDDAARLAGEDNLRLTLARVAEVLG
jgi:8-oxo-dGTP pyrophosphatase MutT (NUDIX family)